jgi:hypothetical protein
MPKPVFGLGCQGLRGSQGRRNLPTALAPGCTSQRYGLPTRRLGDEILPVSTLIKKGQRQGRNGLAKRPKNRGRAIDVENDVLTEYSILFT